MKEIPKIIHQIWSDIVMPLPEHFRMLGETWKEHYPSWEYMFWNNEKMNSFVQTFYPQYWHAYNLFQYDVQRWDAIRYLILDKFGGMYVDFDYESIEPLDVLIEGKSCCFAMEPETHCKIFNKKVMFNNALMICSPEHFFMKRIIDRVFSDEIVYSRDPAKMACVLNTTGPWMLIDLYEAASLGEKSQIYLIPDKYVTPFDVMQTRRFRAGELSDELEDYLSQAYAIHYFFGDWMVNDR